MGAWISTYGQLLPEHRLGAWALNELMERNLITLDTPDDEAARNEHGHVFLSLAGRNAVINWRNVLGDLRISVWWDYDHSKHPQANLEGCCRERFRSSKPIAKRYRYRTFVGVVMSFWLGYPRRKCIRHFGYNFSPFDLYIRKDMRAALEALPAVMPAGLIRNDNFVS